MEGEPVPRHLGIMQKNSKKEVFCIFIVEKLSPATLAYFFSLHKINVSFYGGRTKIIPLELKDFQKVLSSAYLSTKKPNSNDIYHFISKVTNNASKIVNEVEWYQEIRRLASDWIASAN